MGPARHLGLLTSLVPVLLVAAALGACDRKRPSASSRELDESVPRAAHFTDEALVKEAERFVNDAAFRRRELERSLYNPNNTYSKERLTHYGKGNHGWDMLPEWNPRVAELDRARLAALQDHKPTESLAPLWDGRTPSSLAEWQALGKRVFYQYPLRAEPFAPFAIAHREVAERFGVHRDKDGGLPGLVQFIDENDKPQLGITCALCHVAVDAKGEQHVGEARRDFDFGAIRLAQREQTGAYIPPALLGRLHRWGPGRADVTEDDDEDPVAIPDLWGLRYQTFLTQAGTIRHERPAALMLRQETQLLTSNHQRVRPPRALAAALALYIYSLEPQRAANGADGRGRDLFQQHCRSCHANEAGGGDLVSAAAVGTDPALALGAARGTAHYRPPALVRVRSAAPYLHHGAVRSLDELLSPARLEPGYALGRLGVGRISGHTYGTELPAADRQALITYLESL
jgi:cytochrome c5